MSEIVSVEHPDGSREAGVQKGETITVPRGNGRGADTSFSVHSPATIHRDGGRSAICSRNSGGHRR